MTNKEITFRMAKSSDSDFLFRCRNDEEQRKQSFRIEEISSSEHKNWMDSIIGRTDNILLIAEWDGKPVGAFRMDKFTITGVGEAPDVRLISYTVAPEFRRKGIGEALVAEGCVCYGQEYGLIAKIRETNVASRKILETNGFMPLGEVEAGVIAYLRPNDKADSLQ